jgi:hypothetical protein
MKMGSSRSMKVWVCSVYLGASIYRRKYCTQIVPCPMQNQAPHERLFPFALLYMQMVIPATH